MKGGLILEHIKPKDYSHEKLFGSADRTEQIVPLNRDVSKVPQIYQGNKPFCVAATITWIKQFFSNNVDLSHEYLAMIAKIGDNGARPSQVLEPARKHGIASQDAWNQAESSNASILTQSAEQFKVSGYARVTDLSLHGLYTALKRSPLAVGVRDWKGVGPHFMAVHNMTPDGLAFKARNWWEGSEEEVIQLKDIVVAYSFIDKPSVSHEYRAGLVTSMLSWVGLKKKLLAFLTVILGVTGAYFGYTPVTGYESNTTSRISASDTTIPVASVSDKAGRAIEFSNVSGSSTVHIYFTLEPGSSREEIIGCTGKTSVAWTPCDRGLDFQGGSITASSTLAKVHPAGSKIIISNVGQVYREFISIDGTQRIDGQKYFSVIPRQTATTTIPTANDQYATKYYVDTVGAGGFTSANASTTRGLEVFGTSPETLGVNIGSATSGLYFDTLNGYTLKINASTTKGLYIDSDGRLAIDESDNFVWSGTHLFNGNATATGYLRVQTPTSSLDAVNKAYLESSLASVTSTLLTGSRFTLLNTTTTFNNFDGDVPQFTDEGWLRCLVGVNGACGSLIYKYENLKGWGRSFHASGLMTVTAGTGTSTQMIYGFGTSTYSSAPANVLSFPRNYLGFWMKGNGSASNWTIHGMSANSTGSVTSTSLGTFTLNDLVEVNMNYTPSSTAIFTVRINGGTPQSATISTYLPNGNGFYPISAYGANYNALSQVTMWGPLTLEF